MSVLKFPRDTEEEQTYEPKDIHFLAPEVAWILINLKTLRDGHWPGVDDDNIWTESCGHFATPFLAAVFCAAEVTYRLGLTGEDGRICQEYYTDGADLDVLRRKWGYDHRSDVETIERRINRALFYCSGWRRKDKRYKGEKPPK